VQAYWRMMCRSEKCWPHLRNVPILTRSVKNYQDISTMILHTHPLSLKTKVLINFPASMVAIFHTAIFWIWHAVALDWSLPRLTKMWRFCSTLAQKWSEPKYHFSIKLGHNLFNSKHGSSTSFHDIHTYTGRHKKTGTFENPTKIEEIQQKKFDRNWTIITCLLRDSNPNYQCLKIT